MAFTMASGSKGYNVIPREASVCANIRFSVHQNMEESLELLRRRAAKYDIEMELIQGNPASDVLDVNDVKEFVGRQLEYNLAIAKEGLRGNYGSNIGPGASLPQPQLCEHGCPSPD